MIGWIIRHDLLGNGCILKTISERGVGYDRPEKNDEIKYLISVYQEEKVLIEKTEVNITIDKEEAS